MIAHCRYCNRVEAARKLLRELNDAMKSPRGDYYQGDIADPHRALHIVAKHIAAYAEAAVKSAVRTKDDAMAQVTDERDEIARLHGGLTARLAAAVKDWDYWERKWMEAEEKGAIDFNLLALTPPPGGRISKDGP